MKMVDVVVNGYILITVLILSLLVVSWQSIIISMHWRITIILAIQLLEKKESTKCASVS